MINYSRMHAIWIRRTPPRGGSPGNQENSQIKWHFHLPLQPPSPALCHKRVGSFCHLLYYIKKNVFIFSLFLLEVACDWHYKRNSLYLKILSFSFRNRTSKVYSSLSFFKTLFELCFHIKYLINIYVFSSASSFI